MPGYPIKKMGFRKKRVYKKRATKAVTKPTKAFTKKVQAIIHKDVENKQAFHNQATFNFNPPIDSTSELFRVVPNVGNGTADYDRIGDQIRVQSLTIKGCLVMSQLTTDTNNTRICVRMMIVQPKRYGTYTDIQANTNWLSSLLKKGSSTTSFTGVMSDLWADINREEITCYYDKKYYLSTPIGSTAIGYSGDVNNTVKFFTKTFKLRNKLLKYSPNSAGGVQNTHFSPVVLCGFVRLNNSSADPLQTICSIQYDTIMNYEDA